MIAMIVISNRPADFEKFLDSMSVLGSFRSRFMLFAALQPPFTGHEMMLRKVDKYLIEDAAIPPIPYVYYRHQVMCLASQYGAEWFWSLDDDHRFKNGKGDTFNKSCSEYYDDVFGFLNRHDDVGVLSCRGYFGGYSSGYDFITTPSNALVATDKGGMFFRNIGVKNIIEPHEVHLKGALFESLATYNIMMYGFKLARRYNSPISSRPPGKEKQQGISNNISYCDETLNNNIQGMIRRKFCDPTWEHSMKDYPLLLQQEIKKQGWKKNDRIRY